MIDLVRIRGELRVMGRNEAVKLLLERAHEDTKHFLPRVQEGRTVSQLPQACAAEENRHVLKMSIPAQ